MPHAPSDVPVRIVSDTNTALSGLLWQGPPRRLIDLARERTLTLCTSTALLAEVIGRPKFAARIRDAGLSAAEASLIVSGDLDLLVISTFRDIRILGATDALVASQEPPPHSPAKGSA